MTDLWKRWLRDEIVAEGRGVVISLSALYDTYKRGGWVPELGVRGTWRRFLSV